MPRDPIYQRNLLLGSTFLALLLLSSASRAADASAVGKPFLIDMIPRALSAEARQDSEPSLAIDPANPTRLVAAAFTPNPYGSSQALAPVFVSTDGGQTWDLNPIVPASSVQGTKDITVSLVAPAGGTLGTALFAGVLDDSLHVDMLRTDDYLAATPMVLLEERESSDQPVVKSFATGAATRIYLGSNIVLPKGEQAGGKTASLDISLDGGKTFLKRPLILESRPTLNGDLPPVRPVVAGDGSVYVAFMATRSFDRSSNSLIGDVVVTKDSSGGASFDVLKFDVLKGADRLPGLIVAGNRYLWQYDKYLGEQRVGGDLSLAVSPVNPQRLFLAWGEFTAAGYHISFAGSEDGGITWTPIKHSLPNAVNVALAVTASGTLGVLYQQFNPDDPEKSWATVLEQTANDFADSFPPTVLVLAPDDPPRRFDPYMGDYAALAAVGDEFLGVFSTNNHPDPERFPASKPGLPVYQRNVDSERHSLVDKGFPSTASAIAVNAADNSYNRTKGDFTADGFTAGQLIRGSSFANEANNALVRIVTVTPHKITTTGRLVSESACECDVTGFRPVQDSIDPFFFRVAARH